MTRLFVSLAVLVAVVGCGPDASKLSDTRADSDGLATPTDSLTESNAEDTWLPLAAGNRWTFEAQGGARTVSLTGVNAGMARLEGLFDQPRWVAVSSGSPNTLFAWNADKNYWEPFLRFGYAATAWQYGDDACLGMNLLRTANGTLVAGKAGSFSDTRVISATPLSSATALCATPAFTELTFAANLGLVAFRSGTGERFTLASAVVGGTLWPLTTGSVRGAVTLDAPSYTNVPNTVPCDTGPCTSNAATAKATVVFTVANSTPTAVTWHFGTDCQYDVEVASVTGEVVRRLSDGRFCTQAPTQLTVGPSETKTFTAQLSLEDRNGLQLDGAFTLSAHLLGPDGPTPAASLPLDVTIR